jgi:hypothetical protein
MKMNHFYPLHYGRSLYVLFECLDLQVGCYTQFGDWQATDDSSAEIVWLLPESESKSTGTNQT